MFVRWHIFLKIVNKQLRIINKSKRNYLALLNRILASITWGQIFTFWEMQSYEISIFQIKLTVKSLHSIQTKHLEDSFLTIFQVNKWGICKTEQIMTFWWLGHGWPCGPMDKAPDFGSGDCRFESCHGQKIFFWLCYSLTFTWLAIFPNFSYERFSWCIFNNFSQIWFNFDQFSPNFDQNSMKFHLKLMSLALMNRHE